MYKAIVFVRTSTDVQEMESQRSATIEFCKMDGYAGEEIKIIGTNGASAIKLDKLYLQDIEELYRTVESNPIEGIYLFALDRLGRNEPILVTLKQYCIDHKIHLKIKDLNISLLNHDKTVNDGTNILFSVLAAQAASEMRIKKARFERARIRNYEAGKYMGGYIPFGYYIDEKGYYTINEEQAKVIRLIYTLFNGGGYSAEKLAKEMNERGYRNGQGRLFNPQYIRLLLKTPLYTGEDVDKSGRKMIYPPIVTKDEQVKAKQILLANNTIINKAQKHYFFGNKLIVCHVCGHHYLRKAACYTCCGRQLSKREGQSHIANCNNTLSVSVNCLDGILWDLTKKELIKELESDNNSKENDARKNITITQQKLSALRNKLGEYEAKIEEIYLEGDRKMLPEKLIDKRIAVVKKQQDEDNKRLAELKIELARHQQVIENIVERNKYLLSYNAITDVEMRGNEKELSDLVHSYIHKVTIEKTTYNNSNKFVLINIEMQNGTLYKVWFNGRVKIGARAYIWSTEYDYETEYEFENIERTPNGVTTVDIERFKMFTEQLETIAGHAKGSQDMWDKLSGKSNFAELYRKVLANNPQQTMQYINDISARYNW